jgi:hypothetical protein
MSKQEKYIPRLSLNSLLYEVDSLRANGNTHAKTPCQVVFTSRFPSSRTIVAALNSPSISLSILWGPSPTYFLLLTSHRTITYIRSYHHLAPPPGTTIDWTRIPLPGMHVYAASNTAPILGGRSVISPSGLSITETISCFLKGHRVIAHSLRFRSSRR